MPLEKCQFFYFLNFLFLQLRKAFFRPRISRKLEKWPFLDQNHGLAPLEKCQFFDFLNFFFTQPRRTFFRSRVSQKPFSWPLLLIKKGGKMAIFGAKLWVKPLWKNVNFSIFWISRFYSQERCFFALEYRKRHFPDLYCLKKKVGKMAIFDSKPWVNPFGKMF